MPSKSSFFNKTLFRKNLSRFWPLWGGLSLVGAMFPLYMALFLMPSIMAFVLGLKRKSMIFMGSPVDL